MTKYIIIYPRSPYHVTDSIDERTFESIEEARDYIASRPYPFYKDEVINIFQVGEHIRFVADLRVMDDGSLIENGWCMHQFTLRMP